MNFQQYPVTKTIEIEGQMITVPLNTKFVTIDCCYNVQAWCAEPIPDDGWWTGNSLIMTVGEVSDCGNFGCHELN